MKDATSTANTYIRAEMTATDRAAIARWFHHLGAIIEYEAPELA